MNSWILEASMKDWDAREDNHQKLGHLQKGTRLAFMILKRDMRGGGAIREPRELEQEDGLRKEKPLKS